MPKAINWEVRLHIKEKEPYQKLIKFLGESEFYSFEAEPNMMLESTTTHRIIVYCSWTSNLKHLAKWINKNIPDSVEIS